MKNQKAISLLATIVLTLLIHVGYGQILGWTFSAPDSKGNEEVAVARLKDANLKSTQLSRGSALANTNSFTRSFVSKLTLVDGSENTKERAFSKGAYYEFKVQPNKGYTAKLSALNAKLRPGAGGPYYYRWTYSLNGKKIIEIGDKDVEISFDYGKPDGIVQPSLDLSAVADLQKIGSKKGVVFRLYIWGGTNPQTATFTIGRSEANDNKTMVLSLDGEVSPE